MERRTDDTQRLASLAQRYHVSQQDIAQWTEQGHSINDIEWAFRFAETSPGADARAIFEMRAQGASWDDVRRRLETAERGQQNPGEQAEGKKLVPGAQRRTSRYWYRDEADMLEPSSGRYNRTGYEGSPSENHEAADRSANQPDAKSGSPTED